MTEIKLYKFPEFDICKIVEVEKFVYELEQKYRHGETLDEVELTWMDTANTWLMTIG